ncbi:MAG TPA: peptide MFS transporter [Bacteroidia bacterium]|jgi:POT family proton-dependent oligopeptide transporter|nr:peptide MFS transporter [Bacteroidia bacterium]
MENTAVRKGHPRSLYILFLTEMFERFGYYLMVGIFFLYLVGSKAHGGKGFDTLVAADIVGSYIALVYLTPFIGGLLADRILGYRRAIIIGGLLMACGYFGLALPGLPAMFGSLLCIIVGNGFFKPNISTLLGNIYNADDLKPKKDVAYNIFYMGINIGAFFCNFVADIMRHWIGWGAAFSTAGVGMLLALIIFISGSKHVKVGDVVKPVTKEDMPLSKIFGYVFVPAILTGIFGWNLHAIIGHPLFATVSNDAFFCACIPIIIFYIGILLRSSKEDKRGLSALLAFFVASTVFWVIYNQNSTALTIWADQYTDRSIPKSVEKVAKPLYLLQKVTLDSSTQGKVDARFVQQKITQDMQIKLDSVMKPDTTAKKLYATSNGNYPAYTVTFHSKKDNSYIGRGIFDAGADEKNVKEERRNAFLDTKNGEALNILVLDPYLQNLPVNQWPKPKEEINLGSTELFQSLNPFYIVILTPIILGLFGFMKRKGVPLSTPLKIALGMVVAGLSSLVMVFAVKSTNIYLDKTSFVWICTTYGVFSVGELLISPIGLSMVSKLAPARLTALMMGAWFLVNAIAGKISGMMASYWDKFDDKSNYFMLLFVLALCSAVIILFMVKWLSAVVREKTGSN